MLFSIIIPVYGQWHLTKNCLFSIKEIVDVPYEVILVDNGAKALPDDATSIEAPIIGKHLFGENFIYLPQEKNLNFAGACNLGAKNSHSELLFFLNNDTLLTKDFLPPLLEKFSNNTDKIMVGPLLLYPPTGASAEYTIQHIGVFFSPQLSVGHVYEHFPANHRVARREREFQCITGAAFFIRKNHFFELDGFDKNFRNGFEDVDLCGRFKAIGGRMFVVPKSKIVHLCSQTPGRKDSEEYNSKYLHTKQTIKHFVSDYNKILNEDGYELHVNEWLGLEPRLNKRLEESFEPLLIENDYKKIKIQYAKEPYWNKGFDALINHPETTKSEVTLLYAQRLKKNYSFNVYYNYIKYLFQENIDREIFKKINILNVFTEATEDRLASYKKMLASKELSSILKSETEEIIRNHEHFMQTTYKEILTEIKEMIIKYS